MFSGILFQQSLQDLVKGIRAHRRDEDEYIRSKVAEIADECRSADMAKKTTAVLKLVHLQMIGYSIGFASFHVIEVMSCPLFASKRIGYMAAAQSFSPTTDVLLLTTNQFKKDLTNGKLQDCSQALTCLAKLVTEELGRDLEHDLSLLLNSPRPYIRKKALLVLYRLIMVHPDTLPVVSGRFRDRLTDRDPGVTCAAVTVTCELARASPRSFLSLAPILYQLLTNKDSNNWMLIKIVKLMGVLTPLEPRLGKKLVDPLTSLMRTTRAKSLLYECCSTVTSGLMAYPEAVELCAQRLGEFMDETDQNLKYLGLLSMRKLIQAHPHLALEHRDNILDCLDDQDIGIRMRALELVSEFVSKRNLRDISKILLKKLRKASADGYCIEGPAGLGVQTDVGYTSIANQEAPYRESLARQLLRAGEYKRSAEKNKSGYEMLSTGDDFAWYMTVVLAGLSEMPLLSASVRELIGDQLLELTSRVEALRRISVNVSQSLLQARMNTNPEDSSAVSSDSKDHLDRVSDAEASLDGGNGENYPQGKPANTGLHIDGRPSQPEWEDAVLSSSLAGSTAWILGEYSELLEDHIEAARTLVSFPRKGLDAFGVVRILTACVKVYVSCSGSAAPRVHELTMDYIETLIESQFAEVQERAWFFKALLSSTDVSSRNELVPLFEGKLIPVDYRAQSKISVADNLNLEESLLNTGSDSLLTYLSKIVGDDDEEEDFGDDDENLFSEAVFANSTTLSFSGVQTGSIPSYSEPTTLVSGLPETNKAQNPYYLGANSREVASASTLEENEALKSRYDYETGQLSSEAAVLIAEEVPHGLNLSDEEKAADPFPRSGFNERLEAAFEGAFDEPSAQVRVKDEKRKKRKKKKGTKTKSKDIAKGDGSKSTIPEASLIDFDTPSATAGSIGDSVQGAAPKHMADALLM